MSAKKQKRPSELESTITTLLEVCRKKTEDPWAEFQTIRRSVLVIERIQEGHSLSRVKTGSTEFQGLVEWLIKQGAVINKVAASPIAGKGNGLIATEEVKKGDVLVTIPHRAMLTSVHAATASPLAAYARSDNILRTMPNVALALALLTELHTVNSFWLPYIKCLPSTFSTPLFFNDDQLLSLRGTSIFVSALGLWKSVARQYCYFFLEFKKQGFASLPFNSSSFTFVDYKWAVGAAATRENLLASSEGTSPLLGLVPFWDLANHDAFEMSSRYDSAEQTLEFNSSIDVHPGNEVSMCYGSRSNAELVLHSGFFFDAHPDDFMTFALELDLSNPSRVLQAQLLANISIPFQGEFVLYKSNRFDPQTIAFARVASMSKEELTHLMQNPLECAQLGDHASASAASLTLLAVRCEKSLTLAVKALQDFSVESDEVTIMTRKLLESEISILRDNAARFKQMLTSALLRL